MYLDVYKDCETHNNWLTHINQSLASFCRLYPMFGGVRMSQMKGNLLLMLLFALKMYFCKIYIQLFKLLLNVLFINI